MVQRYEEEKIEIKRKKDNLNRIFGRKEGRKLKKLLCAKKHEVINEGKK